MREIKFRVWNKEMETMSSNWFALNCLVHHEEGKKSLIKNVVMQFTGLKDKNGVEIYEGDICRLDSWTPSICEVLFDRGGFCFRSNVNDSYYNDCKYLENSVVIGNIYENPELLKTEAENE
jgi:uncharacterized phage protein (TIGR01671 family)